MANTGLFDSHAHLDDEQFDEDRNAVIERINDNLAGIINPGCDAKSSAFAVKLAEENEKIYAAVGYHPSDLAKIKNANYLDELAAWAAHDKVVAIGEIGLDYYWQDNEPKEVQQKRLLEQIDRSEERRVGKEC